MEKTAKSPPIVWNQQLVLEKIFRFTCLDAHTRKEGWFEVQVAARVVDKRRGEYPVFRFRECNIHLFGHDRSTPVKPQKGVYALAGVSGSHFPTGFGRVLTNGLVIGQDYSFLNYDGTLNCVYAAKVSKVEQMIGRPKLEIDPREVMHFGLKLYQAECEKVRKEIIREKRLQGELVVQTNHGTFHLSAATTDGTRIMTQEGSDGLAIGKLIAVKVGEPMVFSVDKSGSPKRVLTDPVIHINPDPDHE